MKDKLLKVVSKTGTPAILRNLKGESVTVLCLHRISEEEDYFFNPIRPKTFEKLVQYCIKHYDVVTFSEIDSNTTKRKLILSFDDGYYDFIENVVPILDKYEIGCNHNYINSCINNNEVIWTQKLNDAFNHLKNNEITNDPSITAIGASYSSDWFEYYMHVFNFLLSSESSIRNDFIDQLLNAYNLTPSYRMMNWDEIIDCRNNHKVEVGSHTFNHKSLQSVTNDEELITEIDNSIEEFEIKLNSKIEVLSLPNGQYNPTVMEHIKRKGIKYTLLVDDKINATKDVLKVCNLVSRIYLVDEPINEMILRTELFHSKLRRSK